MEQMAWALKKNVLSVPRFHVIGANDFQCKQISGGCTVYSGLKTVTIPQDQDVMEGDFSINFLLLSEWNVLVERVYNR